MELTEKCIFHIPTSYLLKSFKSQMEESLGLYDLESYTVISLSAIAQWKCCWLSNHAVQVQIPAIVVCYLWKISSKNCVNIYKIRGQEKLEYILVFNVQFSPICLEEIKKTFIKPICFYLKLCFISQVRFISDLLNCNFLVATSLISFLENFINIAAEPNIPQVKN